MFLQLVDATQCKVLKQFSVRIILRSIHCVYNTQHFLKSKQLVFIPAFDVAPMPSNLKWKYEGCSACLHISIFIPRQDIFVIQNTKYSSECALHYSISFFHLVSVLFYTTLPALNNFFLTRHCRTSQAVLKTIFLQQLELLHHMCNSLRVSWELQTTSSLMVPNPGCREGGHNFKSNAITAEEATLESDLELPCWRSISFPRWTWSIQSFGLFWVFT